LSPRNCLIKHVRGETEVKGGRGSDLNEKKGSWNLKEEAIDRIIWRTGYR